METKEKLEGIVKLKDCNKEFVDLNLSNSNVEDLILFNVSFKNCDFTKSYFKNCLFYECVFDCCNFSDSSMFHIRGHNTKFVTCIFDDAILLWTMNDGGIYDSRFCRTDIRALYGYNLLLSENKFDSLIRPFFELCFGTINECSFSNLKFSKYSEFHCTRIEDSEFKRADLKTLKLIGSHIAGCKFEASVIHRDVSEEILKALGVEVEE